MEAHEFVCVFEMFRVSTPSCGQTWFHHVSPMMSAWTMAKNVSHLAHEDQRHIRSNDISTSGSGSIDLTADGDAEQLL